ncbi:hypothetical protein FHU39_003762 [Flexivirga oryzae]|uniref:Uncharacterized protein n=1 Tax=Flexivirga oryzae TaxID=1794944 RepID=A0A839NGE0_9MICO|nr:hypothetical protein [Flexivirga oryzae]
MARRGVDLTLRLRAERAGIDPRAHHVYGHPGVGGVDLDGLWQSAEWRIDDLLAGVAATSNCGWAPTAWFVLTASPYVGHLLARHPKLTLHETFDLKVDDTDDARIFRYGLTGSLIDRVMTRSRWSIARAGAATEWTTNDLGMLWLPGYGPGTVLVPVSPRYAFVLAAGSPTYRYGHGRIAMRTYDWSDDDVAVINDLLAMLAPREVYSRSERLADRSRALWQDADTVSNRDGVDAILLRQFEAEQVAYPLLQGQFVDNETSWGRFMAATHQFECSCEEIWSKVGEKDAGRARAAMHGAIATGIASLRRESPRTWEDIIMHGKPSPQVPSVMNAKVVSTDPFLCAIVDRQGIRVLRPDREHGLQGFIRASNSG